MKTIQKYTQFRAAGGSLMLLFLIFFQNVAAQSTTGDSLFGLCKGAVLLTLSSNSENKGNEIGTLQAGWKHSFRENIYSLFAVKTSPNIQGSIINQGYFSVFNPTFKLSSGFFTHQFGKSILYKPNSAHSFLNEKYLVWDSYGFGGEFELIDNIFHAACAATFNNRESGSLFIRSSLNANGINLMLGGGVQTYTTDLQDNMFSAGADFFLNKDFIKIHCCGRYARYTGFGKKTNNTMVSGSLREGFCEVLLQPVKSLTLTNALYYKSFNKRYNSKKLSIGTECCWMFYKDMGIGIDNEYHLTNSLQTNIPGAFLRICPVDNAINLDIGAHRRKTGNATPLHEFYGSLWIRI